jgi:CRP-like cAMP-binding protein
MCRKLLPGVGALCSAHLVQDLLLESDVGQPSGLRSGPISAGQTPPMGPRNRLLLALSAEEFSLLEPQLERAPLTVGMRLVEPNTPIEHVYFLEEGKAAIVAITPQGRRIEAGIIGREGLTGMPVLLGADRTPHECFVQTPGAALRIGADELRRAMAASAPLHQHLLRFAQAFMIQLGQTALANGIYQIEQRLARWLLMCHDRVDGDDLFTTHEFLSLMLGVRRAGVTLALQALEDRGLISTKRGQITVLDRAKLEGVAGDSYGVPEAEYARLIGLPLTSSSSRVQNKRQQ